MERLGQGHLYPLLEEGPRLTCPGRESNLGLRGGRRALIFNIQCFLYLSSYCKITGGHMWGENLSENIGYYSNSFLYFRLHMK
jgi:hypothetical protein